MTADPTDIFLWRALAIFLLIGALMGVTLALLLIFKPRLLTHLYRVANRWVSTQNIDQVMDRSISIEHWFYRHHRMTGAAAVLGAIYTFFYLGFRFDKSTMLHHLSGKISPRLLDGLLDALVLASLVGATLALVVGLFLWLRPSLLRGIEEGANKWVSMGRAADKLDVPHGQVDRYVERHAQRIGWLLLLGSIYLFFIVFRLLV